MQPVDRKLEPELKGKAIVNLIGVSQDDCKHVYDVKHTVSERVLATCSALGFSRVYSTKQYSIRLFQPCGWVCAVVYVQSFTLGPCKLAHPSLLVRRLFPIGLVALL